ncbi:MAG: hypothetical protein HND57_14060 [Planctomycetes bacterium]|nr:hypothetical protein [Planctomycetota bacterium]
MHSRPKTSFLSSPGLYASCAVVMMGAGAAAQQVEYEITVLPQVPDAIYSYATDINNAGQVVGFSSFPWNPYAYRGWIWSEADGLEFLPDPPGEDRLRYAAQAISDTGFIAVDGGGDFGNAWVYKDGVYHMTGTPATPANCVDVNNAGDAVGWYGSAFFGVHLFKYTLAGGFEQLLAPQIGRAYGINNHGIAVANSGADGWRIYPDGTAEIIEGLPSFGSRSPSRITDGGIITGSAGAHDFSAGFYYTDAGGMIEIPWISTWNWAVGVADDGTVAGSSSNSIATWIWHVGDAQVTWLPGLIDPNSGYRLDRVEAINNRGQMVVDAHVDDWQNPDRLIVLTPVDARPYPILGQTGLRRGQETEFVTSGAEPGEEVYFIYSTAGLGEGPCPRQLGGLCLDLLKPVLLGTAVGDANGIARLAVTVPSRAPLGQMVHTQSVIRRGPSGADSVKSEPFYATITD